MKILVTGGGGYIGSFMTKRLLDDGFEVVVADSFERGYKEVVDKRAKLLIGNLLDKEFVKNIFLSDDIEAVINFAGYISMAESVENPGIYFENNVFGALNLLEEMRKREIKKFIFSSTAGVYGNPKSLPIPEDHPKNPTNPYGESKLMVEKILLWYKPFINFVSLRYFNAAGASFDATLGENHKPETHIIPNAINAALTNSEFTLYGDDYNTPDGTCIRDYIHVVDLVDSHALALKKLQTENGGQAFGGQGFFYNVGTGKGYSNKEVFEMVKKISGIDFKVNISGRRSGDAEKLIADPTKIKNELMFIPKYSDLETLVKTAWQWHSKISNTKYQISK
ncbi:MAG: UDP-glucose 4-epimerase GalE [Candidatus Levyibacteriota bacterium]